MKRLASLILLIICLVSLLMAALAGAAISPYNEVTGNVTGNTGDYWVHLTVYDPQFNLHVTYHYHAPSSVQVTSFNISNGIARWVEKAALSNFKHAIYDPDRGWKFGSSQAFWQIDEASLQESYGVVSGWGLDLGLDFNTYYMVYYSTYDPILGYWVEGDYAKRYSFVYPDLVNQDGIVAFRSYYSYPFFPEVRGYIYDYSPGRGWREGRFSSSASFSIESVSLKLVSGEYTEFWGYHPQEGVWQQGLSFCKSRFASSPTQGRKPLWVGFWDLSLGALYKVWTFGDGDAAGPGSMYHCYTKPGTYVAQQLIVGNFGADSTSSTIKVMPTGMPGVPLLLLD